MNPVEVAINIKLQQNPGLIARPARCLRLDPVKAKITEIKFINKDINNPNRVVLADIILKALGKQRNLATINALDKTLHQKTPQLTSQDSSKTRFYNASVFTHSGSGSYLLDSVSDFCSTPGSRSRGTKGLLLGQALASR